MIIKNIISLCTGPAYDSTHHYRYRYSKAARSVKTIYFCRALVPSPTNDQKSTTTVAFIKLGNSLQSNLLRTLIFREFKHRVIDWKRRNKKKAMGRCWFWKRGNYFHFLLAAKPEHSTCHWPLAAKPEHSTCHWPLSRADQIHFRQPVLFFMLRLMGDTGALATCYRRHPVALVPMPSRDDDNASNFMPISEEDRDTITHLIRRR